MKEIRSPLPLQILKAEMKPGPKTAIFWTRYIPLQTAELPPPAGLTADIPALPVESIYGNQSSKQPPFRQVRDLWQSPAFLNNSKES